MRFSFILIAFVTFVTAEASSPSFIDQILKIKDQHLASLKRQTTLVHSTPLGRAAATGDTTIGVCGIGTGSISGVLGAPLDFTDELTLFDEFGHSYATIFPNVPGVFTFQGLYPGRYTIGAGYEEGWLGNTRDPAQAQWVNLAAGQSFSVDTIIIPPPTIISVDSAIISGQLYIGEGNTQPFYGSFYLLFSQVPGTGSEKSMYVATTNNGTFTTKIPSSTQPYYLLITEAISRSYTDLEMVSHPSVQYAPKWIGNEALYATPSSVNIANDINDIEVHLEEGGNLKGTLIDADSIHLQEYVDIKLIEKQTGATIDRLGSSQTGLSGSGSFIMKGIPEGTYVIVASGSEIYTHHYYYPGTSNPDSASTITISNGLTDSIAYTLVKLPNQSSIPSEDSAAITGVISAQGRSAIPANVYVHRNDMTNTLTRPKIGETYTAITTNAGTPISISADAKDIYLAETWYLSTGSTTVSDSASRITLTSGQILSGVDIPLQEAGSIAGHVLDSNNIPISIYGDMAPMVMATDGKHQYSDRCEYGAPLLNGFRITGVMPGKYSLSLAPYTFLETSSIPPQFSAPAFSSTMDSITVSLDSTSTCNISTKQVTGMIRGTIDLGAKAKESSLESYVLAIGTDGSIRGFCDNYCMPAYADTNNISALFHFYECDWYSKANQPLQTRNIAIGGLSSGDYYIALMIETTTGLFIRWYGQDTANTLDDFPDLNKLTVPTDAIKVTLTTDNSLVDGINFGNTAIISRPLNAAHMTLASRQTVNGLHVQWTGVPLGNRAATLSVSALNGRTICSKTVDLKSGSVNLDKNLASGVYLIRLNANDISISKQMIIAR